MSTDVEISAERERIAFEEAYAQRSGVSLELLHAHGRFAIPCNCGDELCEGWQMGHIDEGAHIANLEWQVVEAAIKWYREHGYIPELAATHYEKSLIESTKALIAAREKAERGIHDKQT